MNRSLTTLFLAVAASLAACGGAEGPASEDTRAPFEPATIELVGAKESVMTLDVTGRETLADGVSWSLVLRGEPLTLDVTDNGGTTVLELRDAEDDLMGLGELQPDGGSRFMNGDGIVVIGEAGTTPMADEDMAQHFDPTVPLIFDGYVLDQLDTMDGDGIATSHAALMIVVGLRCDYECESTIAGTKCCCAKGCWADRKGCYCGTAPKLESAYAF